MAVVLCEEGEELAEALLLLEHVHGKDEAMAANVSTSHLGVVEDSVQVFKDGVQLCGGREGGREGYISTSQYSTVSY